MIDIPDARTYTEPARTTVPVKFPGPPIEETHMRERELAAERGDDMSDPRDIVPRLQTAADWHDEQGRPFSAGEDRDAKVEIERLRAINAELLAACKEAERFLDYFANGHTVFVGPGTPNSALAHIRWAIKRAKGDAT